MSGLLFDPVGAPTCLGRLKGLGSRYRLRDPDEELDGLPDGLHFDVLEGEALTGPLITNREALLVTTEEGRKILEVSGLEPVTRATAGDQTVFILRPTAEVDCTPGDDAEEENSSYGRLARTSSLVVDLHALEDPFAAVSGTRLYVFDEATGARIRAAGQQAGLLTSPCAYGPSTPSDWFLVLPERARKVAQFGDVTLTGADRARLPATHPLGAFIRLNDALVTDPERFWPDPKDDAALLRRLYASGAPLPVTTTLTQVKPKASNKLLDLVYSGFLIVSAATLSLFDELGIKGEQAPVDFLSTDGKPMKSKGHVLFRAAPRELVDWASSDVNFTRSHTIWGFRELELDPIRACQDETPLLVHIPGTRLHLARASLVEAVRARGLQGFAFEPIATHAYAYNLDDELTDWQL